MDAIRQYLISIICACVVIAIIRTFLGDKGLSSGLVKLIAGVFVIFTVIAPVIKVRIGDFQDFYNGMSAEAQEYVQQGESMAQQSAKTIIKEQLEAYILDKASALNLDVKITLKLKDAVMATPEEITIYGSASPYSKNMFQKFLTEEMGIPEEKQLWR